MVWKLGSKTVVFTLENEEVNNEDGFLSCRDIRIRASTLLNEQGIEENGILEVQTFTNGLQIMVFATYLNEPVCKILYKFICSEDLLQAYHSANKNTCGKLIYYDGCYYAALFDEKKSDTFCEFAEKIPNAKNYYIFLCEHGKIISNSYVFENTD